MPPESAPPAVPTNPPATAASVVGAVRRRAQNIALIDLVAAKGHYARDVPALLALVDELTAQRDLARDAAVALEQELALESVQPDDYKVPLRPRSAAVLGLGLQPETSEQ